MENKGFNEYESQDGKSEGLSSNIIFEVLNNGPRIEFILESPNIQNLEYGLRKKGIISNEESLIKYKENSGYARSGAETYGCDIEISTKLPEGGIKNYHLYIKAIVAVNSDSALKDWARRREILRSAGVPVSNRHYNGKGIIIEDYYPFESNRVNDIKILKKIEELIVSAGFAPLNIMRDIRCDSKGMPFYVDFGFDLGDIKKK